MTQPNPSTSAPRVPVGLSTVLSVALVVLGAVGAAAAYIAEAQPETKLGLTAGTLVGLITVVTSRTSQVNALVHTRQPVGDWRAASAMLRQPGAVNDVKRAEWPDVVEPGDDDLRAIERDDIVVAEGAPDGGEQ